MSAIGSVTSTPLPTVNYAQSKALGTMEINHATWKLFLYYVDDEGKQVDLPDSFEKGALAKAQTLSRILINAHIDHYKFSLTGRTMIQIDNLGLSLVGNSPFTHDFKLEEADNASFNAIIKKASSTAFKANDVWLEIIRMTGGVLPSNALNRTRLGMHHANSETPDAPAMSHIPCATSHTPHEPQTSQDHRSTGMTRPNTLHQQPMDEGRLSDQKCVDFYRRPPIHLLSDQEFEDRFGRPPIHLFW